MSSLRRVCVFCGSSPGASPAYAEAARELGRLLARRGLGLVYGGGNVGLMGILADAVLAEGGEVTGVIPHSLLVREVGHSRLTDLRVVDTMHERKALMADLSDGFIALPGGIGTLDEWFEIWTWAQLGLHAKPCGLLNVQNYYSPLLAFLDQMVEERFLRDTHRSIVLVNNDPAHLLDRMADHNPPAVEKWIDRSDR